MHRRCTPARLSVAVGAHGPNHQAGAALPALLNAGRLYTEQAAEVGLSKETQHTFLKEQQLQVGTMQEGNRVHSKHTLPKQIFACMQMRCPRQHARCS